MTFILFETNSAKNKSYSGLSVNRTGIYLTRTIEVRLSGEKGWDRVDVWIDKESKTIKISKNPDGKFKRVWSSPVGAKVMEAGMPKGRYILTEGNNGDSAVEDLIFTFQDNVH